MLKTLRLHNFRTFLNAEVTFTDRHLVIGKNNSGKTNLCAALRFLQASACDDLTAAAQVIPGGLAEIKNRAFASDTVKLSCTCELPFEGSQHVYVYDLHLQVATPEPHAEGRPPAVRVVHEQLAVEGSTSNGIILLQSDGHNAHVLEGVSPGRPDADIQAPCDATMLSKIYEHTMNRRTIAFRRYLSSWSYFLFSPEHIRRGWLKGGATPVSLGSHGECLAGMLFDLKSFDEGRYQRVIEYARLVEPDLKFVNFILADGGAFVPRVALRNPPSVSWEGLSDGTLRCLALALVIEMAAQAGDYLVTWSRLPLAIIEEPENGIFPGQLRALFDLFEKRAPQAQFIFTSHSPYFIDFFDGYRNSITLLRRANEITKIVPIPAADEGDPDRPMLSDQYSMGLFD